MSSRSMLGHTSSTCPCSTLLVFRLPAHPAHALLIMEGETGTERGTGGGGGDEEGPVGRKEGLKVQSGHAHEFALLSLALLMRVREEASRQRSKQVSRQAGKQASKQASK